MRNMARVGTILVDLYRLEFKCRTTHALCRNYALVYSYNANVGSLDMYLDPNHLAQVAPDESTVGPKP